MICRRRFNARWCYTFLEVAKPAKAKEKKKNVTLTGLLLLHLHTHPDAAILCCRSLSRSWQPLGAAGWILTGLCQCCTAVALLWALQPCTCPCQASTWLTIPTTHLQLSGATGSNALPATSACSPLRTLYLKFVDAEHNSCGQRRVSTAAVSHSGHFQPCGTLLCTEAHLHLHH